MNIKGCLGIKIWKSCKRKKERKEKRRKKGKEKEEKKKLLKEGEGKKGCKISFSMGFLDFSRGSST